MAKAWDNFMTHALPPQVKAAPARPIDWRKRMSDNIAYALLVYTALQIFMTMGALHGKAARSCPISRWSCWSPRSSRPAAASNPAGTA